MRLFIISHTFFIEKRITTVVQPLLSSHVFFSTQVRVNYGIMLVPVAKAIWIIKFCNCLLDSLQNDFHTIFWLSGYKQRTLELHWNLGRTFKKLNEFFLFKEFFVLLTANVEWFDLIHLDTRLQSL